MQGHEQEAPRLDAPALKAGDHLYTVVIPTIARPEVVPDSYRDLIRTVPPATQIVVVINPKSAADAAQTHAAIEAMGAPPQGWLHVLQFPGPVGFGAAFNAGVAAASAAPEGIGRTIVCYNDDIRATPHWLESLDQTLHECDYVNITAEFNGPGVGRRPIPRDQWGPVGICGPVTTAAAGIQSVTTPEEVEQCGGHAAFAERWRAQAGDEILTASFLSGYCMAFSWACLQDMLIPCPVAGYGAFDSAQYPVAGYEDNDLCVRARRAGWGLAVDWSNYVGHIGHQSFDAAFPEWDRGMRNRLRYYEKWAPLTQKPDQRLVGLYRVKIGSVYDLHLFQQSLQRHASMIDGLAVLLTNEPLADMWEYPDWKQRAQLDSSTQGLLRVWETDEQVEDETQRMIQTMEHFQMWVCAQLVNAPESRFEVDVEALPEGEMPDVPLLVQRWMGAFNEREERNKAIELAYALDPDWLISFDHDEVLEDRVRRGHLDRLMTHPDPGVSAWEFGWIDHWIDARHYRTDPPWGDGGRYTGGRRGRRLWRAMPPGLARETDRIYLGEGEHALHCGNIPDCGVTGHRQSGIRMRHYGYVRQVERVKREEFYNSIDPNPNPVMMGGTSYAHITSSEGMRLEEYNAHNGIGMHMLVYAGTSPGDVARQMDQCYGLADRVVFVATDDEAPQQAWDPTLIAYTRFFKVDVLHRPLRDEDGVVHFARARNVGIDYLQQVNAAEKMGLGWGFFLDPDEHVSPETVIAIRRMAESTECYGWMFLFRNPLRTGQDTPSESVRLHRLIPEMRMQNRVHESFDEAARALSRTTSRPIMRIYREQLLLNRGLSNPLTIDAKLKTYADALTREVEEHPGNGGAWHSLGLQYEAEGMLEQAMYCYTIACQTEPESFIGYRAIGAVKLREARAFIEEAMSRLSPAHPWYKVGSSIADFLQQAAAPADNPATSSVMADLTLPAPPPEVAERMGLTAPAAPEEDEGVLVALEDLPPGLAEQVLSNPAVRASIEEVERAAQEVAQSAREVAEALPTEE